MLGDRKSKRLEMLNRIFLVVFIVFLVQGMLRKWILPSLSSQLFFLADSVVFYCYLYAFYYKLFPDKLQHRLIYLFIVIGFLFVLFQSFLMGSNLVVTIYGWRSYFFLIPLFVLIAKHMDWATVKKILIIYSFASLPSAYIVNLQFQAGPSDFINKGVGNAIGFSAALGKIRPFGIFSFTTGQSLYISVLFSIILINYILTKKEKLFPLWFYLIFVFCSLSMLFQSGSRGLMFSIALQLGLVVISSGLRLNSIQSLKFIGIILALCLGGMYMFVNVFQENYEVTVTRFRDAGGNSELIDRIFGSFIQSNEMLSIPFDWLGSGIGSGSGGGSFLVFGKNQLNLAEDELPRIIAEVGFIMGFAFIIFRLSVIINITVKGLRYLMTHSNAIVVIFPAGMFTNFFVGQMTKQGDTAYFGWLFLGVSYAIFRIISSNFDE